MTPRSASTLLNLGLATLLLAAAGCKSTPTTPATIVDMNNGPDPAAANLAPVANVPQTTAAQPYRQARVLGQRAVAAPQQSSESYPTQPYGESYPAQQYQPDQNYDPADGYDDGQYESQVDAGQQALYAEQAPPPLPEYQQPELTVANDQWTPGYWNYAPQGYYWVPGAWVAPPYQGALWTPPYWGYEGRRYHFHRGFWAQHIGFYGGIPYGHGYTGSGYEGGYWNGGSFYYNRTVQRVNIVNVRNVYERNVTIINNNVTRVSYNGGPGGWRAQPRPAELAVYNERRTPPMQTQITRVRDARADQQQFFSANRGRPAVAVLTQHAEADRTPQPALRQIDTTRNGFGQQPRQNIQQLNQQNQQRQQQLTQQQQQPNAIQQRQQQNENRQQQNENRQQLNQQRQQQNEQAQQQNQQRQQQLQQREQTNAARDAATNNAARQQELENRQAQQQQRQQQLQQNGQRQQQREQQLQQNAQRQQQVQQQMQQRQQPGVERQQQNLNRQPQQQERQQQPDHQQQNPQREQQQPRTQPQPQRQNQPQQQRPQQQAQPHEGPGGGGGHPGPQPHGEHGPGPR